VTSDEKKAAGFKDLIVWKKSMLLATRVYEITGRFPTDERFGLVAQMRRAAVSIPSNIAEGQARHTTKEFIQSISHAEGSLAELDTQFTISTELGLCERLDVSDVSSLTDKIRKMLNSLRRRLVARA
jgi:carbamoyl-phosphate synthase large subunit